MKSILLHIGKKNLLQDVLAEINILALLCTDRIDQICAKTRKLIGKLYR